MQSLACLRSAIRWFEHVKKYAAEHKCSYKDAIKLAGATYTKCGARPYFINKYCSLPGPETPLAIATAAPLQTLTTC